MMNLMTKHMIFCIIPMLPIASAYAAGMDMSQMSMGDMQGMTHSQMKVNDKPIQKVKKVNTRKPMPMTDMKDMKHTQMPMAKMKSMDHGQMPMADMKGMDMSQAPMTDMKGMDMSQAPMTDMKDMDMSQAPMADMKGMDMSQAPMAGMGDMNQMSMGGMQGMSMQSNRPPADARNPDYSQGHGFAMMPPHMMGNGIMYGVLLDRLELTNDGDKTGFGLRSVSWLGTDSNRVVLKLDSSNTKLDQNTLTTGLAWRKPLSGFWNYDLGVQNDHENGKPNQTWLAANINGIAPYWFTLDSTIMLGKSGLVGLVFDGSYDLRITQRLILDPSLNVKVYSKDDPDQEIGKGLSAGSVGLRLRYEVMRTFAPYISVDVNRYFGQTANFYKVKDGTSNETIVSLGVRSWF
jgi:copper resistance protein B